MPVHVNQQNLRLLIKTDFLFNEFLMLNLSFHHAVSYSNVRVCVCGDGGGKEENKLEHQDEDAQWERSDKCL